LKRTADCIFFTETPPGRVLGKNQFMMISLNKNDRLRLFDAPPAVVALVRESIVADWVSGIKEEADQGAYHEFTMNGTPWWSDGATAVFSREFLACLFSRMLALGWAVHATLDVCRKLNDKSVFVMKSCPPQSLLHSCISLNETNKIHLVCPNMALATVIRDTILSSWPFGVESESSTSGSFLWTLKGSPWSSRFSGNESLVARYMMSELLRNLTEHGWDVVSSADLSAKYSKDDGGKPNNGLDVHSWFIAKRQR
jgi:hypothetical protein